MSKAIDISDIELYEFLGVPKYASEKEIKKAYRKRALEVHPDKNLDDSKDKRHEQFQKLQKVVEVLRDVTKKAEYDRKLKAKEEAELRQQQMGEESRRLKRIFNEKEKEAMLRKKEEERKKQEHEWKIQTLKAEGRKRQREEEERWAKEQEEKAKRHKEKEEEKSQGFNIRVSWKVPKNDDEPAYSTEDIRQIFSKYGEVLEVVKSQKKKGLYLVQLDSQDAAIVSLTETGNTSNPLTVSLKFEVKHLPTENLSREPKYDFKNFVEPLLEEKIDFSNFTEPSDHLVYDQSQADKRPAKYVYPEGYDTLFACCRTIQLPPGVSVKDGEEIEHDGYIIKSSKAFDSNSKKKDYGGVTEHYMRQEKERERLIKEMTENEE